MFKTPFKTLLQNYMQYWPLALLEVFLKPYAVVKPSNTLYAAVMCPTHTVCDHSNIP
jgi:hypothetical protein